MKYWTETKGFLLSPLISSCAFVLIYISVSLVLDFEEAVESFKYMLFLFTPVLAAVSLSTFVLGIPTFIIYRKRCINSLKAYLFGGAILGLISPALLLVILDWKAIIDIWWLLEGWSIFSVSSCFGIVSSYSFWRIVVKNPKHTVYTKIVMRKPIEASLLLISLLVTVVYSYVTIKQELILPTKSGHV